MKRKILKTGLLAILALLVFQGAYGTKAEAQAQSNPNEYTMLTPLPCVGDDQDCNKMSQKTTLEKYVPGLFKLAIGLAAAAAVFMIVIGGFQYMTTDAIQGKKQGKDRIMNAIYGLVLVIGAWLILNTINPKLLEINLNIEPATTTQTETGTTGTVSTAGVPMTAEQIKASNDVRESLKMQGVYAYRDPCMQGQPTNCVNLNGLTGTTKDGLVLLKNSCKDNCQVIITAGTESGVHSSTGAHPQGIAVDLRPDSGLNSKLGYASPKEGDTKTVTYKIDGKPSITATFTYEEAGGNKAGTSTGNHWHVTFK